MRATDYYGDRPNLNWVAVLAYWHDQGHGNTTPRFLRTVKPSASIIKPTTNQNVR
jgi:hypothetical protein